MPTLWNVAQRNLFWDVKSLEVAIATAEPIEHGFKTKRICSLPLTAHWLFQ
jgi:hypothetical protein